MSGFKHGDRGLCKPQKKEGEACLDAEERDFACENNLGCLNRICTMYGSLDDYEPTDNELICKSGYMAY